MRTILSEIIKQTNGLFDTIKVTGSAAETRLQAVDKDKVLFLEATLTDPVSEFEGVFGIANLGLLKGLLEFPSYRAEGASFTTKTRQWKEATAVESFEFRDASGAGVSTYRCMAAERVPDQAEIRNIPWDVTLEPSKGSMAEFTQLARLYAEVDKLFGVKTDNGNLLFCFGDDNSSTHRGSMVFASGVSGDIKGEPLWNSGQFIAVMNLCGERPTRIKISSRGVLAVEVDTAIGTFNYYLRAGQR